MTLSFRTVLYATLGAIVVVVAAWMLLIYRPKGDEIADLEEQVTQAQDLEASLRTQLARLEALDEERPSVEAELRRLTAAVPPDPELATLILTMHDQASRSGIDFMQFTPAPPAPGEEAAVIAAGLDVEGSFFTVLDFLDRVEGLDRIIVVDTVDLNAAPPEAVQEQQPQPEQDTGGAGATSGGQGGQGGEVDASDLVTISTEFGQVTTDSTGLDEGPGGTDQGQAGAALVAPQPAPVPMGAYTVRMSLRVRTFTTAQPETAEDDTTTTTAPAGGDGAATTTTTAAGG